MNIININNFEEELNNLILSKKISNDTNIKYNIYSFNNNELQNVLFKIPPLRLIYGYSNQIYNQINFPLNPTYQKTKQFSKFISSLENKIQELLNKPDIEWVSNLKKIKNIKNIKLNCYDKNNIKIISNDIGITDIKDFMAYSEVEIVVHISHIWIRDNKGGMSFNITHIKYTSLPNMLNFNPFNTENIQKKIKEPTKITDSNITKLTVFRPSMEILNLQKNKLKSISN
jgi:hypothetical protein